MTRKSAFITGASRGIGRSIALLFASHDWHVYINCNTSFDEIRHVKKEIDALACGSCEILTGDVGSPDDVRTMFQTILGKGGIDLLVNNAGIAHIGLLSDMTDDEWNRIIQTNLSSVFYCCRSAIPHMVSRKSGRIINISSMWGTVGASCEAAYSASKSGVHGLTKALAKELAPSNIQVNAIACGVIDTAMNRQLSETEKKELAYEIPAGRFAHPEEVADLVFDLACGHTYLTGQIIGFDGGFI